MVQFIKAIALLILIGCGLIVSLLIVYAVHTGARATSDKERATQFVNSTGTRLALAIYEYHGIHHAFPSNLNAIPYYRYYTPQTGDGNWDYRSDDPERFVLTFRFVTHDGEHQFTVNQFSKTRFVYNLDHRKMAEYGPD